MKISLIFPLIRCVAIILLLLVSHAAVGITNGTRSEEPLVVTFWFGDMRRGSGVFLTPELIMTTGKVVSPNRAKHARFISHTDGNRKPQLFPGISGEIEKGTEFGPIVIENPITNEQETVEGPVLLMVKHSDSPKFERLPFPLLPNEEEMPGSMSGNQSHLRVLGFGTTGTSDSIRSEGSVAFGKLLSYTSPNGPFVFHTNKSNVGNEITHGDIGGPVFDNNLLVGIHVIAPRHAQALASQEYRAISGVHFWLASPEIRRWIMRTAKQWNTALPKSR